MHYIYYITYTPSTFTSPLNANYNIIITLILPIFHFVMDLTICRHPFDHCLSRNVKEQID